MAYSKYPKSGLVKAKPKTSKRTGTHTTKGLASRMDERKKRSGNIGDSHVKPASHIIGVANYKRAKTMPKKDPFEFAHIF